MVDGRRRDLAFVFPGQASQRAGMAGALLEQEPAARSVFQRAGEVLGLDLAEACTTGSDALLTRTDMAQPALLTTCVGWYKALAECGVAPGMVAGHSLGEFSAWVAAGVLGFDGALRLVRRRGELMEQAGQRRPGGMVAVVGLADSRVIDICKQAESAGVVVAASFNSPGQVVVSGEPGALEQVAELAEAAGARVIPLRVSGAFHSPLMEDAAHSFSELVGRLPLEEPWVPVIGNSTGEPVSDAESARRAMSRQMTSPVLWAASVRRMVADGVTLFAEVGPGKVLSGLIRRIAPEARVASAGTPAELAAAIQEQGQ